MPKLDVMGAGTIMCGWIVEDCPKCGGSGFSGYGTGYDDVCGECGGTQYLPLDKIIPTGPDDPEDD